MGLPDEVVQIPVARLKTFPEHPFYVRDDDMLHQLVESIRQVGVLMPIIVRRSENECYEIISGHRRKHACELLARLSSSHMESSFRNNSFSSSSSHTRPR